MLTSSLFLENYDNNDTANLFMQRLFITAYKSWFLDNIKLWNKNIISISIFKSQIV